MWRFYRFYLFNVCRKKVEEMVCCRIEVFMDFSK